MQSPSINLERSILRWREHKRRNAPSATKKAHTLRPASHSLAIINIITHAAHPISQFLDRSKGCRHFCPEHPIQIGCRQCMSTLRLRRSLRSPLLPKKASILPCWRWGGGWKRSQRRTSFFRVQFHQPCKMASQNESDGLTGAGLNQSINSIHTRRRLVTCRG